MISREISNKEVLTVYTERESGARRPVPESRRRQPVLDDEMAAELARYGARIEELYGSPQDISGRLRAGLFILQARPITALPEPGPIPDRLERA